MLKLKLQYFGHLVKKTQQLAFLSASLAHYSLWEEGSFVENSPVKRLTVWRCSPL